RDEEVALHAGPQGEHLGIVGGALHAAIPRAVVLLAVAVVLAVGVVVAVVVGDQVAQTEAVVGGDVGDAGVGQAPGGRVEIGAAGQPRGELGQGAIGPPPVVTQGVAGAAAALRRVGGEVADLIR